MTYAMFIDYEYCSGCHTCEVACQKELGLAPDEFGIKIVEMQPEQAIPGRWQRDNLPYPTDRCNACASRLEKGKRASCEQHCQSDCVRVGELSEIAKLLDGDHQVVYTLFDQEAACARHDEMVSAYYGEGDSSRSAFDVIPEADSAPVASDDGECGPAGLSKNSKLSDILANPQAVALLETMTPGCTQEPGIVQAAQMGLTLAALQQFASDVITDEGLAAMDAQLRTL